MSAARPELSLAIAGGGVAGAALAASIARAGASVCLVERETAFSDRVRGEVLYPWGVAELEALGLSGAAASCTTPIRSWTTHESGDARTRDLVESGMHRLPALTFFHPDLQEALLREAAAAGATVMRGATVTGLERAGSVTVSVRQSGRRLDLRPTLLVGADGRGSTVRRLAGFDIASDARRLTIVGLRAWNVAVGSDALHFAWNPPAGQVSIIPTGNGAYRVYVVTAGRSAPDPGAIRERLASCAPPQTIGHCLDHATVGPLVAAFAGADRWTPHPHRDGVVLIGDAAAATDPSWGCGVALALRDVRMLRDQLLASSDWSTAAEVWAAEHDHAYGALHRLTGWMTELLYAEGADADAVRARALPLLAADRRRIPDLVCAGPDARSDETVRRRLFAEV